MVDIVDTSNLDKDIEMPDAHPLESENWMNECQNLGIAEGIAAVNAMLARVHPQNVNFRQYNPHHRQNRNFHNRQGCGFNGPYHGQNFRDGSSENSVSAHLIDSFEAIANDDLQAPFQTGFQDHLFPTHSTRSSEPQSPLPSK
ncbi:hypothetical protein PoHVEF18_002361 [Penicillium ochrochloron]